MTAKATTNESSEPVDQGTEGQEQDRSWRPAREQNIRHRAYEIYLERGGEPGHDLEDWLQAEREFTTAQS